MDRSVLLVDAGYLLASGGQRICRTTIRSALQVNIPALIAGMVDHVTTISDLPVLRTYWYDAAHHGVPTSDHRGIGVLPGVKLRLGRIGMSGEQKGVDLRLGLDVVSLARNQAVQVAYLVTGDDDMAEAVEAAQEHGVQVIVLAVPALDGGLLSVATNLVVQADDAQPLPLELLEATFALRDPVREARTPEEDRRPVPTPADLAAHTQRITNPAVASAGAAFTIDATTSAAVPAAIGVGERMAETWYSRATDPQIADLRQSQPQIPPELDRGLILELATHVGEDLAGSQFLRYRMRGAFWDAVDRLLT